MDAKALNAAVHDREAAFYDERFAISFDGRLAATVRRDLQRVAGPLPYAAQALDYCCGTGFAAVGMASGGIARSVHACDLSPKMIEQARANAARVGVAVHASVCDGERLPYDDSSFELIVARGALHHLPDPVTALCEL
ncbi:MAG: class I SAM-dependent methyltransferase, partial [Actinomycetota bacterium]